MKSLHEKVEGIYGYPRMMLNMNRRFNQNFNHKRIYRLMKVSSLQSVTRKKKKCYKYNSPKHVVDNI